MPTQDEIAGATRIVSVDMETTGQPMKTAGEVARMPRGMRLPGIIIQIGCIELLRDGDGWTRGRMWETLVNPDGPINPRAQKVHGIHISQLKNAPRFADVLGELREMFQDSMLLAHAARNEASFLNYEFRRAGLASWDAEPPYHEDQFIDTQLIARGIFPGISGSLDAICDRLWIHPDTRDTHHGALLDADLTAEAFIKMTSGFVMDEVRTLSI